MKNRIAAFAVTTLISAAPLAQAASSTDLTVTGSITPAACTPTFANGGMIDLGKISAKDLKPTQVTLIGRPTTQMIVTCDAPTTFALQATDNRPNTTVSGYFGVGLTPAGEKLGHYIPTITNVLADGQAAASIESPDQGATWGATNSVRPNRYLSVSATADTNTPIAAKDVSMDMEIPTWILRSDGLTLNEEITIDGSATLEMKYL
ncbi:MAG TPA: DUF1120 domain-containing protein [Pseudomonas sp.]|nr:DUF1120 domain-containing protein [Pseudomonas sp.]